MKERGRGGVERCRRRWRREAEVKEEAEVEAEVEMVDGDCDECVDG